MLATDQTIILASVVIKDRENKVLFLQRSSESKHYPLYWQLPEGKIEPNESPVEAIKRELKEEIGYQPKRIDLRWVYPTTVKVSKLEVSLIRVIFAFRGDPSVKISNDHLAFEWCFPKEAIKKLKLVPGTSEILEKA